MKYSCDIPEAIKKYVIKDNNLIIYYLNSRKKIIKDYTKKDLIKLEQMMLKQAFIRDLDNYKDNMDEKVTEYYVKCKTLSGVALFLSSCSSFYIATHIRENIKELLLAMALDIGIITIFFNYHGKYFKQQELTKYHLFLKNKELLEYLDNNININNLDKYKLKDIYNLLEKIRLMTINLDSYQKEDNIYYKVESIEDMSKNLITLRIKDDKDLFLKYHLLRKDNAFIDNINLYHKEGNIYTDGKNYELNGSKLTLKKQETI